MQTNVKNLSDTRVELAIVADEALLKKAKEVVLKSFARNAKIQGFRPGKAPLSVVEKNIDPAQLQSEFLNEAVNRLYIAASDEQKLRAAGQPEVNITKFVPFDTLEITATVDVVGKIKLADYKKLKAVKRDVKVTAKDVDGVLENLTQREAEKKEVTRAAKDGDEVTLDFAGLDTKTKEAIAGADGKDYPLVLGSNSFIPGFEPEVVGIKTGETKSFDITFPKDYGVAALQSKKVTFTITAKKVSELVKPKIDDELAAKVGPFKTVQELKDDIKKQLGAEQENQANRDFENQLLEEIVQGTTVAIPDSLVDEQLDQLENDERQNLIYRGQTWEEHLKLEGVTNEQHREKNREPARQRVVAGLVLSEIAELEKITVEPEEFEMRMQLLKGQYPDKQMQEELDKPEGRRNILSRMVTEKTIAKIVQHNSKKK